jgi:hypothetical protein
MVWVCRHELLGGDRERRQRRFHVGRATAEQNAVAFGRHKRIRLPVLARPGRHHIGMTGEHDRGPLAAAPQPKIRGAVALDRLGSEAKRR